MEESLAGLAPEERYTKRLELEKPVLDALLAWANETMPKTAPKSALGKALHYLLEQWPYLVRYLEDGRLELSNNRAERSIKPFVMGRKNWLFSASVKGAEASALVYSVAATACANGLKVESAELEMVANDMVDPLDKVDSVLKLIDMLEDNDDVQNVYHNAILPEEEEE